MKRAKKSWSASRGVGLVTLLLAVLAGTGCVPPPLDPLSATRTAGGLDADEASLWKESRELQYKIQVSGLLLENAEVDRYLAQVLARATPKTLKDAGLEPRVEVINDVNIHGYSFANGVVYIHSGLLARMENENHLATMFTRELAHVANRNALRAKRQKRSNADLMAWLGVGAPLVENGGNVKLLIQAAQMTTALGFHHSIETIADEKGLEFLDEAGYPVSETPGLYETTLGYLGEAHKQGPWAWAPFAPPPPVVARVEGMKGLIATKWSDQTARRAPILGANAFRRKIHPVTIRQAELELASGLFWSAETTALLATESQPRDPKAWLLLGQARAGQRTKPAIVGAVHPSRAKIEAPFEEVLRLDRSHADATRELAFCHYKPADGARSREDAREALRLFRRYLSLAPRAQDRGYVEAYVTELQGELR